MTDGIIRSTDVSFPRLYNNTSNIQHGVNGGESRVRVDTASCTCDSSRDLPLTHAVLESLVNFVELGVSEQGQGWGALHPRGVRTRESGVAGGFPGARPRTPTLLMDHISHEA